MVAAQTAEQKAAADKAAADAKAAEEKAKQEADAKAAADKAAADAKAPAAAKGMKVVGAAVVLRADDGSERYFYRGAPVDPAAFSKDSIKHAVSVGLIEKAK